MNIKANLKYIMTGSVIFLIIYMFVAAIPMGSDIYLEPDWTTEISPQTDGAAADPRAFTESGVEAFVLGDRYGYFTADGKILSSSATDDRVSATTSAWAVYPEDARETAIHNPDGSVKATIAASGFTWLDDDRAYLFIPGGDAVSQYDAKGQKLWTREHTAPITAFNSSENGTVIGYADGLFVCVAPDGTEKFAFYPGGSDREVILGAALSKDGTLAACVSGIDRQRFILVRISNGQHKIVFHTYLKGNLHRQAFVNFEDSGRYVFFESEDNLGIFDCKKMTASAIPVFGRVISAGEYPGESLFVALVKNGSRYTLAAIERPDPHAATMKFSATNAFLIQREGSVYLGTDSTISRINIRGLK
jgi:hypothetical protein